MENIALKNNRCSVSLCAHNTENAYYYFFAVRFFAYCFFYYFYADIRKPQKAQNLAAGI